MIAWFWRQFERLMTWALGPPYDVASAHIEEQIEIQTSCHCWGPYSPTDPRTVHRAGCPFLRCGR